MDVKEINGKLQLAQNTIAKIAEANRALGNDKVADELTYSVTLIRESRDEIRLCDN